MKTKNLKILANHISDINKNTQVATCNDHEIRLIVQRESTSRIKKYTKSDLLIFLLEGDMEVYTGGGNIKMNPWDFLTIPHNEPFQVKANKKAIYTTMSRVDQKSEEQKNFSGDYLPTLYNVYSEYNKYPENYHNIELARVNDHFFRMGIVKGEYPEHHHTNSDVFFFFVEGEYHLAHMMGEDNFHPWDIAVMKKYESHKPYVPKRSLMLYFEKRDIKTVTYEGADFLYYTD